MSDTPEAVVVNSQELPVTDSKIQEGAQPVMERQRDERGKFAKAETTPPANEVATETQGETAPEADKSKNRTTEFINRLKEENRQFRQQQQEYERRMAAMEARLPKQPEPQAPDPNSFYLDPAGYVQQSSQHAVREARQAWEQEQQARAKQQQSERIAADFRTKGEAFAVDHPDFQEVIFSVPPDLLPEDLALDIIGHERGPELAYHLGKNRRDLLELVKSPPHLRAYEIEDLASRLTATLQAPPPAVVPPAKTVTRAPAPPTTLGGAPPAVKKPYSQMNQAEYEAARRAERRRKGLRD